MCTGPRLFGLGITEMMAIKLFFGLKYQRGVPSFSALWLN